MDHWLNSYSVMTTAFIMTNLLDLGTLERYHAKMTKYAANYGRDT